MVVLGLRYFSSVKSYWRKINVLTIPVYTDIANFYLLTTPKPLNINLGARNLYRADNFGGPTYPLNFVFLVVPVANCQGESSGVEIWHTLFYINLP